LQSIKRETYHPFKTMKKQYTSLKQLGKNAKQPTSPDQALLESVLNTKKVSENYVVRFTCPEFTSICPITEQPDFAHLVIDYIPNKYLLESKSLKLFLNSFRNHGAFHEECTTMIAQKIIKAIKPKWLRIGGYWNPRGGIPIDIFYQTKNPPKNIWIPENYKAYTGRS